jgi:hypothetical protein
VLAFFSSKSNNARFLACLLACLLVRKACLLEGSPGAIVEGREVWLALIGSLEFSAFDTDASVSTQGCMQCKNAFAFWLFVAVQATPAA